MSISPDTTTDERRCDAEQARIMGEPTGPLWLKLMGWADWEIERELIRERESAPTELIRERESAPTCPR